MNDAYISYFTIKELKFENTYTSGSLQSYSMPCIGYLKEGMGIFFCEGKTYYANKGDLIYIAKDTKYYSVWYGEPKIEFYSVSFDFTHPYSFYDYRFQIVSGVGADKFECMLENCNDYPMRAISTMYSVLDELYPLMKKEESHRKSEGIDLAVAHIESKYFEPLAIDELCAICHCSRSSLFELFKKRTGVSPIIYKHNLMIQHALDMLAHTDLTVDEISQKTGFSSSNYFRTVFRKMTGKAPGEVKKVKS